MKLFCLSGQANQPCFVIKFKGTTVMMDCGLDMSTVANFLPLPLVPSSRLCRLQPWICKESAEFARLEAELRQCDGKVFVNAEPEFRIPECGLLDMSEVDVILLSNYHNMLALPYITEGTGFKGVIYSTEPTLHIGRLFMEELVSYIHRSPSSEKSAFWKDKHLRKILPCPLKDAVAPQTWRKCYSLHAIQSCLSRVDIVSFNESKDIFGSLSATAVSSGYCIGSCNWVLQSAHEKIAYLSASSTLTTHPKPMEQLPLKNADVLILASLTQTPTTNPDAMIGEFCVNAATTLKNGGNVLIPCSPSGVVYDLFECLSSHLDNCGLSVVPMYFISPVADSSLAYSNIYAEWLSTAKQSKVYVPEFPFPHAELVKCNRLRHFASIQDGFHTAMRSPCVVFTGHPSLRFGDAVHFMELWGGNSANAVIFTEPDFLYHEALSPYQPLAMKAFYCPIDTSLSFVQANKLIRELSPAHVVISCKYTVPPTSFSQRQDLVIDTDVTTHVYDGCDVITLPVKRQFERVELSPELAGKVEPKEIQPGVGVAMVSGLLVANDNQYTLQESVDDQNRENSSALPVVRSAAKCAYGALDVLDFVSRLKQKGFIARVETIAEGHVIIELPNSSALIRVENGSTHVICQGGESLRASLRDTLLQCLRQLP